MRRWSLNGDIYVSLLGKASIGGDRHYLRHTSSNSVDFVVRSVIFFPERCASIMSTDECPWKPKGVRWDLTIVGIRHWSLISIQGISFRWNSLLHQSYFMLLNLHFLFGNDDDNCCMHGEGKIEVLWLPLF